MNSVGPLPVIVTLANFGAAAAETTECFAFSVWL